MRSAIRAATGRAHLAVTAFAFAALACKPQPRAPSAEAGTVDTAAVVAAIDSLRDAYERSIAADDLASMSTLLADGAVMVQPGSADWNAMAAAAAGAPFPPGASIDITPIEVRVLSPEWAYEFGTSVVTYTPAGAREARTLNDTYLVLFRKTAGGWKAFREVASSKALPPPATQPAR